VVVEQVHPRLQLTFTATLRRARGDGPDQIALTRGQVDVAMPDDCP
jgi:hypothetical protein